jgi:hypothetical protein
MLERGTRLVEDQDRCIAQQGSRNRDPLLLALGEGGSGFTEHGVIAFRKRTDQVMNTGRSRCLLDRPVVGP